MKQALISLGGNLGEPSEAIAAAVSHLDSDSRFSIQRVSSHYRTPAIGGADPQPDFVNAAVLMQTNLSPHKLLSVLQNIEEKFGRTRSQRWDARSLDLDLLLFDDAIINDDTLELPHRRMAFRRFVLKPAAEIAPEMLHPQLGWTISELCEHAETAFPLFAFRNRGETWADDLLATVLQQPTHCCGCAEFENQKPFPTDANSILSWADAAERTTDFSEWILKLRASMELLTRPALEKQLGESSAVFISWQPDDVVRRMREKLPATGLDTITAAIRQTQFETVPPKLVVAPAHCVRTGRAPCPELIVDDSNIEWAAREVNAAAVAMATEPVKISR